MRMLRRFFSAVRGWYRSKDCKICDICSAHCDNAIDTGRYCIPLVHCECCVQKMVHELLECNKVLKESCHTRQMAVTYDHTKEEWQVYAFLNGNDKLVLTTNDKQKAEMYLDHAVNQEQRTNG